MDSRTRIRNEAFDILANKGRADFMRHCTRERDVAQATGYEGAAEFWQRLLDEASGTDALSNATRPPRTPDAFTPAYKGEEP